MPGQEDALGYNITSRFTTEQKPLWWKDERFSHVRIEVDLTRPWVPLQRHIWTCHDGREWVEEWIPTLPKTKEEDLLNRGWKPLDTTDVA